MSTSSGLKSRLELPAASLDICHVGCAGWAIPITSRQRFEPFEGSHLENYAMQFDTVEINSSFYRPHLPRTYSRWADSVPDHFTFSVKVPRQITHNRRLIGVDDELRSFLSGVMHLRGKLAVLLVQLPPSLSFEVSAASTFFGHFRDMFAGNIACEPRHASWFTPAAEALLNNFLVARVAADPAVTADAGGPGAYQGFVYIRLHGSPHMYYSSYEPSRLAAYSATLSGFAQRQLPTRCIFDNTAAGAAMENAFALRDAHAAPTMGPWLVRSSSSQSRRAHPV